jgi:hypothetical protein
MAKTFVAARFHERRGGYYLTMTGPEQSPVSRTDEQEVASGRTAATPVAVISGVIGVVAAAVLVVLALVVIGYVLA